MDYFQSHLIKKLFPEKRRAEVLSLPEEKIQDLILRDVARLQRDNERLGRQLKRKNRQYEALLQQEFNFGDNK